jgi:hypothetical protein
MSGGPDPLYIAARRVLLHALEALGSQRAAVILVGQAIYLHTGAIDLAVAEYTTDADITLDPDLLDIAKGCALEILGRGSRASERWYG